MSAFLGKARGLQKQQAEVEARAGQIQAFLEKFILSDAEVASLRHDPIDKVVPGTGACLHMYVCGVWTPIGTCRPTRLPLPLPSHDLHVNTPHQPTILRDHLPQASAPSLRPCSACRKSASGAASWWAPSTRRRGSRCSRYIHTYIIC